MRTKDKIQEIQKEGGENMSAEKKTTKNERVSSIYNAKEPNAKIHTEDTDANVTAAGSKTKGRLSRFMGVILAAAVAFGTFGAGVGMWMSGGPTEVRADDLVNTVPNEEVTSGSFYSGTINTGFSPNNYNTEAVYGPGYGPYTVDGVYQSQSGTSATSFAAGLPLGTIFIDQSKIGGDPSLYTYKVVSDKTDIIAGLVEQPATNGETTQMYDGTRPGARKLEAGKVNVLEGDLYTITFVDAAVLPNGERADLEITYSNARIVIDQRYTQAPEGEQYLHGAAYLSKGNSFSRGTLDKTDFRNVSYAAQAEAVVKAEANKYYYGTTQINFSNANAPTPAIGTSLDATYRIVNKDGTPAAGTFVFAISGINLDRDPDMGTGGNNVNKPLWYTYVNDFDGENGKEYSYFSEALSINGGQVSDNVYVRPNNDLKDNPTSGAGDKGRYFWPYIEKDSDGKLKFISNATNSPSLGGHDDSYSAGFVTLADAAQGMKVTGTGHGGGNATGTMNSGVFVSKQIWYRYVSGSGPHGKIETTSEGNWGGKLNDGGTVLDGGKNPDAEGASNNDKPNTYVIAEGKTVTYTMTPDIGYKLKKLTVNGEEVKYDGAAVSKMKKGDTVTVNTAAGHDGVLTYEGDGTYTFKFVYAESDENIFVEWEPTTADVLVAKRWQDEDDKDGLRAAATMPNVKLQYSTNRGRTWTDVTDKVGNYTIADFADPVTPQTVPDGNFLDGSYDINNDQTGRHPYTWEYLPVYTYDSNGVADNPIWYQIVEIPDPGITDYKKAQYFDDQSFDLTSPKTKSRDGWLMFKDSSNTLYAQKGDGLYYIIDADTGYSETTPATNQPTNVTPYTTDTYWTVDKGSPYQAVEVKNEHTPREVYIDLTKFWNDESVKGLVTKDGNEYARKVLTFILHGETDVGPVDLNGDGAGNDREIVIEVNESDAKEAVTGDKTIGSYVIYKDSTDTEYAFVKDDSTHEDGYYPVVNDAIDYENGPVPGLTDLKPVPKGDGTYKIDDDNFGALIEHLSTHEEGKPITYTITEKIDGKDANSDELAWTTAGGELKPVRNAADEIIGYTSKFINTPVVDKIVNALDITIKKQDKITEGVLENATFTVYTNAVSKEKAKEYGPEKINGEQVYTDDIDKYVKRENKYYLVGTDGSIATEPANPQPDERTIKESYAGGVLENEVTTDSLGSTTVTFKEPGTYYIEETTAPVGYTANPTTYTFVVDAELKSIILKGADGDHQTSYWEKIFDLLFGLDTYDGEGWAPDADKKGGTLTVKDDPIRANILINKVWDDNNDQDGLRKYRQELPKVKIQKTTTPENESSWVDVNSTAVPAPDKTIPENNAPLIVDQDNYYTWDNLPAYEDGKLLTYRVIEFGGKLKDGSDFLPGGDHPEETAYSWTALTAVDPAAEFNIANITDPDNPTSRNRTVTVTNKHIPEKINLSVSKDWADDDDDTSQRVAANLTLYKTVNGAESVVEIRDAAVPLNDATKFYTWENLPAYEDGYPVTYRVEESAVDHYATTYKKNYTDTSGAPVNEEGDSVEASDINRTWDNTSRAETTEATINIKNANLQELKVYKTWIKGSNANVTYKIYRTTSIDDAVINWDQAKGPGTDSQIDQTQKVYNWTPDSNWEEVTTVDFTASLFATSDTGDRKEKPIPGLPKADPDGNLYTYRVWEDADASRYEANQVSNTEVVNTNLRAQDGIANVNVVKELQGREWNENDKFYFKIEPFMDDGTIYHNADAYGYDAAGNKITDPSEVPVPAAGKEIQDTDKNKAQVGAIGRNVGFDSISFTTQQVDKGETAEYYYKVYEVYDAAGTSLNDATQGTGRVKGITYAGTVAGGVFKPAEHTLKIVVASDANGKISTDMYWDDSTTQSAVPVYTNSYDAEGEIHAHVIKQIQGREIIGNDEFNFNIENIAGAPMRANEADAADTSHQIHHTGGIKTATGTKVTPSSDNYDPADGDGGNYRAIRSQDSNWIKVGDLAHKTADGKAATDTFIYRLSENAPDTGDPKSVANDGDLTFDGRYIYMKIVATDNLDGTLKIEKSYWYDATCTTSPVEANVLTKKDDGTIASAGAVPGEDYAYEPAAIFTNSQTIDISVRKEWVDAPAVEDVTLHLKRKLIPMDQEAGLTYNGAESAAGLNGWETVGNVTIAARGDFLNDDGTPKYDTGTTTASKTYENVDGFNKDLPMYVTVNGTTYRAVYKLEEDKTSDAYTTTYRSEKEGAVTDKNQIYLGGETLVVTNKVVASNEANIAAVKQLMGRQWIDSDDFPFTLEPEGKGTYDADGKYSGKDDSDEAKATVPMPKDDTGRESTTADADTKDAVATTHAKKTMIKVDPNGGLERLARFGAIEFDTNDLTWVKDHYEGDFFYIMKEVIPEGATQNSDGSYSKGGITYDGTPHEVHIKVTGNRTDKLYVQIAYDEETEGDVTSGTQFTPVYTNKYEAKSTAEVQIDKYLMGRGFKEGETFTFEMRPVGSSPFFNENGEKISGDVLAQTITVGSGDTEKETLNDAFDKLSFTLSDLPWTVGPEGVKDPRGIGTDPKIYYSDNSLEPVSEGTKYGRFVYAVTEKEASESDLATDTDTEYVRITVIDKGDGTLDTKIDYFEDSACTIPRKKPDDSGVVTAAPFVNKLKRNIKATKAWDMPATSDVTLKLQWSLNGTNWYDVADTLWMGRTDGTKVIPKDASGDELTVEWKDLPTYSNYSNNNGDDGDDKDLDDKWILYRIAELPIAYVDTRYNTVPYAAGDTVNTKTTDPSTGQEINKYAEAVNSGSPYTTEAETAETAVNQLYVTNFRQELYGTAEFGVVKQYIGKVWEDEEFTFEVIPVKSALGGASEINNGTYYEKGEKPEGMDQDTYDALENIIYKDAYDDLDGTVKAVYSEKENKMPALADNNATADTGSGDVSVNEHAANFNPLTIKLSDLKTDPADGKAKGIFYYTIREVIPPGATMITEGEGENAKTYYVKTVVGEDGKGKTIKYTADTHTLKIIAIDDGSGEIHITESFDDRGVGEFVPVYTNYAMMPTPIEGTKTWSGGPVEDHVNGTVTLDKNNTVVTSATDNLGLKLYRKLNKDGEDELKHVTKDAAGRELAIVWVKATPRSTPTTTQGYFPTKDTEVVPTKTYYIPDESANDGYSAVVNPGDVDPSEQHWYEYGDITTTTVTYSYEPQEGGDGNGPYTYTVMAKVVDEDTGAIYYEAPFLYAVDNDGYTYEYSIVEGNVPENYTHAENGLHIENTVGEPVNVPVTKEWKNGPAVEDVTIRLQKTLVPLQSYVLSQQTDVEVGKKYYTYDETTGKYTEVKNPTGSPKDNDWYELEDTVIDYSDLDGYTWTNTGLIYNIPRAIFVERDGTPKYDEGSQDTSSVAYDGTTEETDHKKDFIEVYKNLPKYETNKDGVDCRVVYKIVEDDTSGAYTTTYRTVNGGSSVHDTGAYYLNEGDMPVITNTVKATNEANIAAVKQFMGRQWLDRDDFAFTLTPEGKAVYYTEEAAAIYNEEHKDDDGFTPVHAGDFMGISDSEKAKVPMPADDASRDSQTEGEGTADVESTTHTKKKGDGSGTDYPVVDPNGGLERLARFGAITYNVSDLVYNPTDKDMQGDFYYIMKEKLPAIVTTGDNQNYPVEYTVIKKEEGQPDKTVTKTIDNKAMPQLEEGETLKSIKFSDGITYDCDEHKVHVKVRENSTKELVVQVAYDYTDPDDISTGTQFTPVYTNRYDAEGTQDATIEKHIMGRTFKEGEKFTFTVTPVGGSPFKNADGTPITAGSFDVDIEIGNEDAGKTEKPQTGRKIEFDLEDLNWVVGESDSEGNNQDARDTSKDKKVIYSDGITIPEPGMKYGRFMYGVKESKFTPAPNEPDDLIIDDSTEYIMVTVIDKGDGTLDTSYEIYGDPYGNEKRYKPGTESGTNPVPADKLTLVNQLKRDLSVTKAWKSTALSDVTLKLQWTTKNPKDTDFKDTDWHDVSEASWLKNVPATQTINQEDTGNKLTKTWSDLPAYADDDDKLDLNDKWVYYRVVEEGIDHVTTRYSTEAFATSDTPDMPDKYSEDPIYTEDEDAADRVTQTYVANFPNDLTGIANVDVVKQFIGTAWEDDVSFTFVIDPVKGIDENGKAIPFDESEADQKDKVPLPVKTTENGRMIYNDGNGTKYYYDAKEGKLYTTAEGTEPAPDTVVFDNLIPDDHTTTATARNDTAFVSVNEHDASFDPIAIKLSDIDYETEGEFYYMVKEHVEGARTIVEGGKTYWVKDGIKYTTEEHVVKVVVVNDGSGKLTTTVSYDDRNAGDFVPVYTNYALHTSLSGEKIWIGGNDNEHVNSSAEEGATDNAKAGTDQLGLVLQRTTTPDVETSWEPLTKTDAGNDITFIWTKVKGNSTYTVKAINKDQPDTGADDYLLDPVLNVTDKDGYEYHYRVQEGTVPIGYKVTYDAQDTGKTITNTCVKTDNLKVTKTWDDQSDNLGLRPEKVTVHLYKEIEDAATAKIVQAEVAKKKITKQGTETDDWTTGITWTDLPVYDETGKKIKYIVIEESVTGYTTKYAVDSTDYKDEGADSLKIELDGQKDKTDSESTTDNPQTVSVKNTVVNETDTVKVTKYWDDAGNIDGMRPDSVNISVYEYVWTGEGTDAAYKKNDTAVATITLDGEADAAPSGDTVKIKEIAPADANTWKGEVTDLPATKNGKTVIYEVDETRLENYDAPIITGNQADGFTVTNKRVPAAGCIEVKKVWDDNNNQDGKRQDAVMTLKATTGTGDTAETTTVGEKTISADINEPQEAVWHDLPVYRKGQRITYTVEEAAIPGYTTTYSEPDGVQLDENNDTKTMTVTNAYTAQTAKLTVTKKWFDENNTDGIRDNVTLHLTGSIGDTRFESLKFEDKTIPVDKATADGADAGTAVWENLPVYHDGKEIIYTVTEEALPGYNAVVSGIVTDPATGERTATVTNSRTPAVTKIKVTKVWDDADDVDGIRPDKISVTLMQRVWDPQTGEYGDATEYPVKVELDGKADPGDKAAKETASWEATFGELPEYANGKPIIYTAKEVTDLTGSGYDEPVYGGDAENGFTVTNTHKPETIEVKVTKVWDDNNNIDQLRPNSVKAVLYADGKPVTTKTITTPKDSEREAVVTFTELPKNRAGVHNEAIEYTVKEESEPAGYTSKITGTQNSGYTITNTHVTETASLKITKIWDDNDDRDGLRPEELKVKVTGDDTKDPYENTVTLKSSGDWTTTLEGLRLYKVGTTDEKVTYTISGETVEVTGDNNVTFDTDETKNPDYIIVYGEPTTLESDRVEELTVTNKHTPETIDIAVDKEWSDHNDQDGVRPNEVEIRLYNSEDDNIKVLTLNAANNWNDVFRNVKKNSNGKAIVYKVVESITAALENAGYVAEEKENDDGSWTITNTRNAADITDVSVTKVWDDGNDTDGKRPTVVTFTDDLKLYADGEASDRKPASKTDNGDGTYTYTWTGLQKNRTKTSAEAATEAINYTIKETTVPDGYAVVGDSEVASGGAITNRHAPGTTTVTITKKWEDASDQDGIRPAAEEFKNSLTLRADGTDVTAENADKLNVTESADNTYTVTWTGLAAKAAGKDIAYTVDEANVTGYTADKSSGLKDGDTVTNTHEPGTTSVTITKVWDDDSDRDGIRPKATDYDDMVTLNGNGVPVNTKPEVTDNGDNTFTLVWNNIQASKDGSAIDYTVDESAITGYTADKSKDIKDGDTITNKHDIKTRSITVIKKWDDAEFIDQANYNRPMDVSAELYDLSGDKEVKVGDTVGLSEANGWSYTWTVPVNSAGEVIEYEIREVNVPVGFEYSGNVKATGTDDFTATITNKPKTEDAAPNKLDLVVTKTNNKDKVLAGAKFLVTAPDKSAKEYVTNDRGELSITFEKEGTYTVKEIEAPDGYTIGDAKEYTVEVGKDFVKVHLDKENSVWTKLYELVFRDTDAFKDRYTAGKALVIGNPPAEYNVTIVKTFTGIDALPDTFKVNVAYTDVEGAPQTAVLELADAVKKEAGKVTWVFDKATYHSSVTVSEADYAAAGYTTEVVKGVDTLFIEGDANASLENTYEAPEEITVKYVDPETGEVYEEKVIKKGEDEPAQPADPTREGYTFKGWERVVDPDTGDVTYEARWEEVPEPGKIVVKYIDPDTGEEYLSETINKGDNEPGQPADPTKEGYTFGGWLREVDKDGNVTYKANWIKDPDTPEPEKVKVTHDDGMGNVTTVEIDKDGKEPDQPADPVREGYTFGGWDRTENDDGNVIYTARWIEDPKPEQITVTYKDGDKTIISQLINKGDDEPGQPADPADKEGYTFGGWDRTIDADGNVIYNARWVEKETPPETAKTITYIDPMADNALIKSKHEGEAGADIDPEGTPAHDDMDFVGWDEVKDADGNIIRFARYVPNCDNVQNKTLVRYRSIDGEKEDVYQTSYIEDYKEGDDIPPYTGDEPVREGYLFDGWGDPEYVKDDEGKITDIFITAKWKEVPKVKTHTVKYVDPDGHTIYLEKTGVKEGDKVDPPENPTREGYDFDGWTDPVTDPDTGDVTYTAKWKEKPPVPEKTHTVEYVDEDGTVYYGPVTVKDGEKEPDAPEDPKKDGYIFGGWIRNVDKDGNVTYTAKWLPDTHTVTYVDGRTGKVIEVVPDIPLHGDAKVPDAPAHEGYEFKGWRTPDGELVTDLKVKDVIRDLVYTAVYDPTEKPVPLVHTVTFIDSITGDEIKIDNNVPDGGSTATPVVPDHQDENYVFKGWWTPDNELVTDLQVEDVREDQTYVALYDRVYEEAITGKRIIHFRYIDKEGREVEEDRVDSVRFTRTATVDAITGETTFSEWTPRYHTFPEEDVPDVEGFVPDMDRIPEQTVWPNGKNEELWVIYTPVATEETKTVSRTVKFRYYTADGEEAAADVVQTVTLKRSWTIDPDTKERIYTDWEITGREHEDPQIPEIEGFIPDMTEIPEFVVDLKDPKDGEDVVVIYDKEPQKTFTVKFEDGQGNVLKVQEGIPEHGYAQAPEDPKREGYAFIGWDKKFDDVTGDLIVTALWEKEYTVTYKEAGPDGKIYTKVVVVHGDEEPPEPDPKDMVKAGFIFDGWDEEIDEHGNKTFTARWIPEDKPVPDTHWITYVDEDGTVYMEKTTVNKGDKEPDAPAVKKDGYEFVGWNKTTDADGNVVYTAVWKKVEEPVTPDQPAQPVTPDQPGTVPSRTTPASGSVTPAVTPDRTSGVDTGDNNFTALWIVMAAAAAGAAVAAAVAMRRRKGEEE